MRKLIGIIVTALLFASATYAQDAKGKFSIDLNFDPAAIFDANAGSMFEMPYIKSRFFVSSDLAIRLGLGYSYKSEKEYMSADPDVDDYNKTTTSTIIFAPGIEKQFGSDKFFAYLGAQIPFTNQSEKSKAEIGGETFEAKNPDGNAYFGVGLDFIFGFDYYILNNLYIGAELAPGLMYLKYKDSEDTDGEVVAKGGNETSFSLAASSGIRIGVRF